MFLMNSIDFMLMGVYIMSWLNSLTVLPLTKMMLLCALWIITLGLHYICQNVFRFKPSVIMFTGPQEVKARGEGGSSWFRGRHKAHRSKVVGPQHHFWAHSITFFFNFFFFFHFSLMPLSRYCFFYCWSARTSWLHFLCLLVTERAAHCSGIFCLPAFV